jgi:hypothetical protein
MHRRSFLAGAAGAALGSAFPAWGAADTLGSIAFIRGDGLWMRRLPDGELKMLVAGKAAGKAIESPEFSPSGKWIAYSQAGVPHVVSVEGREARELSAEQAAAQWLPDRDEMLVESPAGLNLFSAISAWTKPALEIRSACLPVLFDPNGRQIIYSDAVTKGRGPGGEPMRTGRLCRRPLEGGTGQNEVLASKYLVAQIPFGWSRSTCDVIFWEDPDFSASVAADGLELFRIPASGGPPKALGVSTLVRRDMLAFSSRQDKLAVIAGDGRESWTNKRAAVIDLKSGGTTYLTGQSMVAVSPSWSPGGERIAFSAAPSQPPGPTIGGGEPARRLLAQRRIWVVDAGGSAPRQLTNDARYRDEEPMWSPDGQHILFARLDGMNNKTLWLMNADGGNLALVAGPLAGSGSDAWFGFYGYIDWRSTMDWFRD